MLHTSCITIIQTTENTNYQETTSTDELGTQQSANPIAHVLGASVWKEGQGEWVGLEMDGIDVLASGSCVLN